MYPLWRIGISFLLLSGLSWSKVLYDSRGVMVVLSETIETMEFCVRAPESVYASIMVDRNQNGRIDRGVDTLYALDQDKQRICTAYLLGVQHTTFCGGFKSEAQLTDIRHEHGQWQYTFSIPKRELSADSRSVWVAIGF